MVRISEIQCNFCGNKISKQIIDKENYLILCNYCGIRQSGNIKK